VSTHQDNIRLHLVELKLLQHSFFIVSVGCCLSELFFFLPVFLELLNSRLEIFNPLLQLESFQMDLTLLPLAVHYFILFFIDVFREKEVEGGIGDFDTEVNVPELVIQVFDQLHYRKVHFLARCELSKRHELHGLHDGGGYGPVVSRL